MSNSIQTRVSSRDGGAPSALTDLSKDLGASLGSLSCGDDTELNRLSASLMSNTAANAVASALAAQFQIVIDAKSVNLSVL